MLSLRNKKNYLGIILKNPPYLELWLNVTILNIGTEVIRVDFSEIALSKSAKFLNRSAVSYNSV